MSSLLFQQTVIQMRDLRKAGRTKEAWEVYRDAMDRLPTFEAMHLRDKMTSGKECALARPPGETTA
jgi:hypothetical protein